jgi:hypothetical protein
MTKHNVMALKQTKEKKKTNIDNQLLQMRYNEFPKETFSYE